MYAGRANTEGIWSQRSTWDDLVIAVACGDIAKTVRDRHSTLNTTNAGLLQMQMATGVKDHCRTVNHCCSLEVIQMPKDHYCTVSERWLFGAMQILNITTEHRAIAGCLRVTQTRRHLGLKITLQRRFVIILWIHYNCASYNFQVLKFILFSDSPPPPYCRQEISFLNKIEGMIAFHILFCFFHVCFYM